MADCVYWSVVFLGIFFANCTNGDGGGNSVGNEAGASLGQMREIEARRALAAYGISNVWFLAGHDTPGQNVLRSLDSWNHGRALDEVVRLVRITQPDVILTWLPDAVVGENHDDHQASSVLAVEAFDAAGDPTIFPEQVSPPRDRDHRDALVLVERDARQVAADHHIVVGV
jgi:LmbE family N-acetylglucosaminyl deacetylase